MSHVSRLIGVLAFQGDVAEHVEVLRSLRVSTTEVRTLDDLRSIDALIIPGGESTVMSRFLQLFEMMEPLKKQIEEGMPVFGTCAGAILLGKKALGKNAPKTLGAIDIDVDRNAYGSQLESFDVDVKVTGIQLPVHAAFIRAPIIKRVGEGIDILATHDGDPILVKKGNVLAGTFHPEVRGQTAVHKLFLRMVKK